MLKRLAWLWLAMLMIPCALAADTAPAAASKPVLPATPKMGLNPAQRNRIMAPDAYQNHVVKVLRTTNKAQTNSYVPVVFDMKNVNPFSVIRFLLRPIQPEEGLLFTFVNPSGKGGKVMYVVPPYMIESLRALVASIDRAGMTTSTGDVRLYARLHHRRAHPSDPSFLDTAASYSTNDGTVTIADPEVNALFYMDSKSAADAALEALPSFLDVPTPMVEMVVKVYEIDSNNDATIGQDYIAWKNGPGANLFAVGAFAESASIDRVKNLNGSIVVPPAYSGDALGVPGRRIRSEGYNAAYQYATSAAFFDFLQVKGKARLLNQVKLAALNTKLAEMTAGDQVLYYKTTVANDAKDGVRDTGDIYASKNETRTVVPTTIKGALTPVETGIHVAFRPLISQETINLDMVVNWSDYTGFDDQGVPQISKRKFDSRFRMGVNDELVLGGFQRQVRVRTHQGVPILSRIPILGYIFGGESETNKNTQVIVVVKPVTIFNYSVAGNYRISADDQLVIDKATGREPIQKPDVKAGFDMYGLDADRAAKTDEISDKPGSYNQIDASDPAKVGPIVR